MKRNWKWFQLSLTNPNFHQWKFDHHREAEGIVDWLTKKSGPQWTEVESKVKTEEEKIPSPPPLPYSLKATVSQKDKR